ncbi:MAG: hypothetical protein UY74_C0066G0001, partial [Candidatus Kaiserbacteria bacterium GW2011_GWC2_52_8b]
MQSPNTKAPGKCGCFCRALHSIDIDGVRSFRAFRYIKRHFVAFSQILVIHILQLVGVEKEIFFLSLAL